MSELYSSLPYTVTYQGHAYRLRPFFNNVLELLDTLRRTDLTEESKVEYGLFLLMDERRYPCEAGLLDAIIRLLVKQQGSSGQPRTIDMTQDAPLIYSAFRQAYGIDLHTDPLHWQEFVTLLGGLPSDTRLMEVVQIRTRPVPRPNKYNADEIRELMRLKALYRIRLTEEEAEAQYQSGLQHMAQSMMSRI